MLQYVTAETLTFRRQWVGGFVFSNALTVNDIWIWLPPTRLKNRGSADSIFITT